MTEIMLNKQSNRKYPPYLYKKNQEWFVFLGIVSAVVLFTFIIRPQFLKPLWTYFGDTAYLLIGTSPSYISVLWLIINRVRLLQSVRNHEYTVCLNCGYPLGGLARKGICPECSKTYDIRVTKIVWERTCIRSYSLCIFTACIAIFRGKRMTPS